MAAKSVLKSSVSALFALALGTAALMPGTAFAQERQDRGERGAGRMERQERAAPMQAPAWQNRAPAPAQAPPQQSWQGRPTFSQGTGAPPPQAREGGWQGRPAWQGGDRDRGNGGGSNGQPAFGRPGWANNGAPQATQGSTPTWQGRNPTYVDPARNPQAGRDNRWAEGRGDRDGQRDGQRDGDRDGRAWQRDRAGNNNWQNRDNRWSNNNTWRDRDNRWNNNGWRGNNGWRDRDDRWRGNAWGYNNGNNWGSNGRRWDRDGWRRDNRYDWYGWRNRHRDTFSLGFYSAPWRGYSYNRFSIGVVIGAPFYAEQYWIADPWAYRLPAAWGPYRWVRYYDDALLVDIYTGEVVDAIYDIFY